MEWVVCGITRIRAREVVRLASRGLSAPFELVPSEVSRHAQWHYIYGLALFNLWLEKACLRLAASLHISWSRHFNEVCTFGATTSRQYAALIPHDRSMQCCSYGQEVCSDATTCKKFAMLLWLATGLKCYYHMPEVSCAASTFKKFQCCYQK